uniref:Protein kinase domain-containing protein n=1 Tax=Physcomitrium patens TaxID=3218 RepID=A0A2K1JYC9_PHYPA|nr:hypothetical protein PHYPA_013657 [Physcomitrium patens]
MRLKHYSNKIEYNIIEEFILSSNIKSLVIIRQLNKGTYDKVYKSKWLDLVCATKKIDIEFDRTFIKVINILVRLTHFYFVKYYFAVKKNANESSPCCIPIKKKKKKKKKLVFRDKIDESKFKEDVRII